MTVFTGRTWRIGHDRAISLDRPRVMAILNITPDSFADGGRLMSLDAALDAARAAVQAGADILDIGGESTRPGANRVKPAEQINRVCPVIEAIRSQNEPFGSIPISIDTTLAPVAQSAIDAGADIINDVSAGVEDMTIHPLAARTRSGLILMHRLTAPSGDSYSDQYAAEPRYEDVVAHVAQFLADRASAAQTAGVEPARVVLDPGLGFGKTIEQNLDLIRGTGRLCELGYPILSAASRKSFVGRVSLERDSAPSERLAGSIAFSVAHFLSGASVFRVHDVAEHVQALRAAMTIGRPEMGGGPA